MLEEFKLGTPCRIYKIYQKQNDIFHMTWSTMDKKSRLIRHEAKALLDEESSILIARNWGKDYKEEQYKDEFEVITAVSALPDWNKSSYVYFYNSPYKSDLFRCATSKIMWGEVEKNILSKMDQKIFQSLFDHSTGTKKLYYFCAHGYDK
jgi:hypothetical protein